MIDPAWALISFQIGENVSLGDLDQFGDRVRVLDNGKIWLTGFISFQYGTLSKACPAHKPVFKAIKLHGLDTLLNRVSDRVSNTLQDKEKDKEKEKDSDGGAGEEVETQSTAEDQAEFNPLSRTPVGDVPRAQRVEQWPEEVNLDRTRLFQEYPPWELVKAFADQVGLAEWRARDWFDEMEGCGWIDHQKRPIFKWQSVLMRVKAWWDADGRPSGPKSNTLKKNPTSNGRGRIAKSHDPDGDASGY